MALLTPSTQVSLDAATAMYAPQITGLILGESCTLGAPLYIKSSDGKAYQSNGTALNEAAEFVGIASRSGRPGEPITAFGFGTRFRYGTALTPGDIYYLAATAGRYDTVATVGDTLGTLQAISNTDVRVVRTGAKGA